MFFCDFMKEFMAKQLLSLCLNANFIFQIYGNPHLGVRYSEITVLFKFFINFYL
jgi:hypothetical protein